MAPNNASGARRRALKPVNRLRREEDEKNKDHIAKLEEALKKKDDEFATAVDGMDLDPDEEDNDVPSNDVEDKSQVKKELEDGDDRPMKDIEGVEREGKEEQKGDGGTGGEKEKQNKQKKDGERKKDEEEGKGDAKKKKEKGKKKKVAIASVEEDSDSESSELFVPDDSSSDGSDSESDADSVAFSDKEYGKPLFSFPGIQPSDDAKTVGWRNRQSNPFINMHGKKSRARYRLEESAYPLTYEDNKPDSENVSNPNNRYGDTRSANGKFKYSKRHVLQIYGVAYKSQGTTVESSDVEGINPENNPDWKTIPTFVLIAWQLSNGEVAKSWEPRSCLRRIYKPQKADEIIYQAALKAEDRYLEAKTGLKKAYSRSPSRGLADEYVERERQKSLDGPRSPSPVTRGIKSKSPRAHSPDKNKFKEEFLANYCELAGVGRFLDLSIKDRGDCIASWEYAKVPDWRIYLLI